MVEAIDNRFEEFLKYENLIQSCDNLSHYYDEMYKCWFYHDFDKYKSLDKQFYNVKQKYNRRIEKFLKEIEKPTLFIRYINSENTDNNKSNELIWIENNIDYIRNTIKKYNSKNEIIFISNKNCYSSLIKLYKVEIDECDIVCRNPLIKNETLNDFFDKTIHNSREINLVRFKRKTKKNNNKVRKIVNKTKKSYVNFL